MPNFNHPYKTLVLVNASINPTLAFSVTPPSDLYERGTQWKLTIAGTTKLPESGFIRRTVKIGDIEISRLQGSPRGSFPICFYDEIFFSVYADGLFDIQSRGSTAVSSVNEVNPETNLRDPEPGLVEWSNSTYDSPNVDRTLPIDIILFASPIPHPLSVTLNAISLVRIAG